MKWSMLDFKELWINRDEQFTFIYPEAGGYVFWLAAGYLYVRPLDKKPF